jgi:hypothetical protein
VALKARKTEHSGPKKKCGGGYWGLRADAKFESRRARRKQDRVAIEEQRRTDD